MSLRCSLMNARTALLLGALGACAIPDTQFAPVNEEPGPDATLAIVTSATSLEVVEAAEGAIMVSLNRAPTEALRVSASTLSKKVALGQADLMFTADNFAQPQRLAITGLADADTVVEQAEITLSAPGVTSVAIATTVRDDDTMLLVSDVGTGGVVTINEAGSAVVRVHLSAQPTSEIRVDVLVAAGPVSVSAPTSRVFTPQNYDVDQLFTFVAADDANVVTEDVAMTLRSMGIPDKLATLRAVDDDTLNLAVTPSSLQVTEQGTPGQVSVSLTQQPAANVTVAVATMTGQATIDRTQLVFTPQNYSIQQAVNVTAPDDNDVADGSDTVRISATGLTERTAAITIRDNDTQQLVSDATPPLAVAENGSTTFNVTLRYRPAADVVVAVSSMAPGVATVTPGVLRFTSADYATPHPVTVRGADDANLVGNSTTIRLSEASLANLDHLVNVTDDDTQRFVLTATSLSVPEGANKTFDVSLAYEPAGTVSCTVVSSNAAALPVMPGSLSFTAASYATPVRVTVSAPADSNNVSESSDIKVTGCGAPVPATVMAAVADGTMLHQFGWPMPFTATTSIPQGMVVAYKVSVAVTSSLDSFGIWVPAAAGDFRMALYANSNNAPGGLVAQMPVRRPLVNGSNTADITPDPTIPVGDYWLVLRVGQSTAVGYSGPNVTGLQCVRNFDLPSLDDPWPANFGASSCTTDRLLNLWTNNFSQP